MKIGKSKGSSGVGKTGKGTGTSSTSVDFRLLLQSQLQGVAPLSPPTPVTEVAEREVVPPQLRMEGLQMAEASIDSLDAFAKALTDASISAADLESFVTALEEESQGLVDIQEQLPKDDPLGQLIELVATACFVETTKYRRGDYQ